MTTRFAVWGLAVALVATAAQAADQPAKLDFKEFNSKEGRFKILMPGTPKEQTQKVSPEGAPVVNQHQFLYDGGTSAFLVAYQDDQNFANADDATIKNALNAGRDAAANSLKGKILSQKEIKFDNTYPGLDFQISLKIGDMDAIYRSRIFMAKERLYQVTVVAPTEVATSKDADRFLDSFKLTGAK